MNINRFNVFKKKGSIEVATATLQKPAPDIPGILPVLSVDKLLRPHTGYITSLKELAGLSEPNFDRFYKTSIHNFARLVQLLPASEVHHHANPGGMLAHTLDVCVIALKKRRSYVLSTSNNAEDVSAEQDIWTYSIFLAALCHDLAKPRVDQTITIYDLNHKVYQWTPWANFLDEQGQWYTCQFVKKRTYKLHEKASPLLIHKVVPCQGMEWISSNQTIFMQWLATVSGDHEHALSIGEIISFADSKSVANNLGAESSNVVASTTKVKPLHEKMLTALRFLLLEGELPLNRNGAAGWIKENDCWLVSKRTIDAIRDQLSHEGHTGLPSKNGRMYDILQEHAILSPSGNKAIWKVTINGEDWSNELTVIKIPVSKIWINHTNRPDDFHGTVIVSEEEHKENDAIENTVATDKTKETNQVDFDDNSDIKTTELLKSPEHQDKATINTLDISSFLPSPIQNIHEITHDENQTTLDDKDQPEKEEKIVIKENFPPQELSHKTCDVQFFEWLQDGVLSGIIKTNAAKARVHVVSDGVIVVTPGIFQDFSESTQNKVDWKNTQKKVLKQKLHIRDDNGLNVIKYEVKGRNRMTKINTILFDDPALIFGETTPPSQNPHLTRVS
jgi:integrating conjugative element relaxase (TIGR03760 family)